MSLLIGVKQHGTQGEPNDRYPSTRPSLASGVASENDQCTRCDFGGRGIGGCGGANEGRFRYWDANGNGDLTCTEARGRDEGLKLPAYRDNRNSTGVIYEWLERRTSSDTDNDGIACESTSNPNGYVPGSAPPPPPPSTSSRECPAGSATWMGLPVCEEGARVGYDRNAFGSAYSSLEDEIIDGLPKSGGQVYTPYTCTLFAIRSDGTADTDIEHIVALAEAYDSGLAESQFRTFAGDLDNLTIADPTVNRTQKSDRDAAEWGPPQNSGWFAARVVVVKQKYALSVNPAERDALQAMLNSDASRTVTCGGGMAETTPDNVSTPGGESDFHIIAQIADGFFADNSYYKTTFMVIPVSPLDTPTCSVRLYGLQVTLDSVTSDQFTIPFSQSDYWLAQTSANQALARGHATITCDDAVYAQALFTYYTAEGSKIGEATGFSSAGGASRNRFFVDSTDGASLGIAIANNELVPVTYDVEFSDNTSQITGLVTIPARTSNAFFLNEVLSLPAGVSGIVEIKSRQSERFAALGLRYTGQVFTTIPAN